MGKVSTHSFKKAGMKVGSKMFTVEELQLVRRLLTKGPK